VKRGAVYLVSQSSPSLAKGGVSGPEKEQALLRPVVLVSREAINRVSAVVLVCPLVEAAGLQQMYPSDVRIAAPEGGLTTDSVALTAQLRAVPRTQIVRHLGELSAEVMRQVDQALRITLDLD